MNEFSTYEYVVARAKVGKYRLARIALFCGYILYVIGFFLVFALARLFVPLIALIPLTTWILVFFTWRYVNVDYEYSITSGVITLTKIYGNRTRKTITSMTLKNAAVIAPLSWKHPQYDAYHAEQVYNILSSPDTPDAYCILYVDENQMRCAILFEATSQALKICRFYNAPATVVSPVRY